MSRLAERYKSEVVTALQKEFGYTNVMAIPKLERIVVNMTAWFRLPCHVCEIFEG